MAVIRNRAVAFRAMAKVTIYLPDALRRKLREPANESINVSEVCRVALIRAVAERRQAEPVDA